MGLVAKNIRITGLVQGVGFRPFVYRHATRLGLKGWVRNHSGGVEVLIEGPERRCSEFVNTLALRVPRSSLITSLEEQNTPVENRSVFEIKQSLNGSLDITCISPDIAVCPRCLNDLKTQPHRLNYSFTNCAHCGPRFSIVAGIPYDRNNTSMQPFEMCPGCNREYRVMEDRRFHAQTISCNHCGPRYRWVTRDSEKNRFDVILRQMSSALLRGDVIAVKGTGGFHLLCDARNEASIRRIREIKQRHSKPLAVMFRDLDTLKQFARVNEMEEALLLSWRRPIVVLGAIAPPSPEVNRGFSTIGAILPYTAFHHLLMDNIETPAVVFTSANLKGQPLISGNDAAMEFFREQFCDALLIHNREIRNKQDDSIVQHIADRTFVIRRARGFVPEPVFLNMDAEGVLAMGADLKNTFCIGKDNRAILSQYTGDLEDFDVFRHYCKIMDDFRAIFKFQPRWIALDSHPEYHSSRYGKELSETMAPANPRAVIGIQHHHAHIASVLAEHQLDEKVIGIAMDGTGYGDDRKIWGSEFLICDLEGYRRMAHLAYLPLPGGDKAIKEPWRLAVAVLYQTLGETYLDLPLRFHQFAAREKQRTVIRALKNKVNIYESCGMGRLFDAVAALLNLVHISNFDGEAPVKLENIYCHDPAGYPVRLQNDEYRYEPVIRGVVDDLLKGVPKEIISGRFHNTITEMICHGVQMASLATGLKKVALSGGIFQNKIITENVISRLGRQGFQVFTNRQVPCNDGGIALGQLAIATKKIKNQCV